MTVVLAHSQTGHVSRALRLGGGSAIVIFDGSGRDFDALITTADRQKVEVLVGNERPTLDESPLSVCLLQAMCRTHRMDTVMQKATELGVHSIQVVTTERCVVKFDRHRSERKLEHWQRIVISAAEQCGRSILPDVHSPVSLAEAIADHQDTPLRLMLDPDSHQDFRGLPAMASSAVLLIGPEGGLTGLEEDLAHRAGFQGIRLGPRILRTETAPTAALSILQFLLGDL